jgi:hypothetical protein
VPGTVTVTAPGSLVATTPSATTPVSTANPGTSPPVASPATNAQIAFTGALLSGEWLVGMAALLLGSGLVVLARWRRRTPGHAAK